MIDYKGVQIHYRKGTKVMLIKAFDRSLFACVNNKDIYVPKEIATHKSKDLNPDYKKHRESYIPLMNQPCRRSALQNKKPCKNKTFKTKRARDGTRTLRHLANPHKIKEEIHCLQGVFNFYMIFTYKFIVFIILLIFKLEILK